MRKVFKNGNSLAVTVPKTYAHELSIRDGSQIEWRKTEEGLLLTNQRASKKPTEIDPEVAKLIKKLSKKYSGVWQDLSRV
ncbi:AbrB/MazE/SpoVT family DNA-binding domain-containing protein [Candidatus Daviesbacteria bacterium]|nr:AbrB/MazE/SpoVT family DNA-binding domain-containing protein [Candidatus Daviesbacteria bacterium]